MYYSIYHFFRSLVDQKSQFWEIPKLEDFPFDKNLLSCRNLGQFPDIAIRISPVNQLFTGGELIELKDSDSYTVSSFNSTIPAGRKEIEKIFKGENSVIKQQMEQLGDDIFSLPKREVYYLVRGKNKKKSAQKIALIHGNFLRR